MTTTAQIVQYSYSPPPPQTKPPQSVSRKIPDTAETAKKIKRLELTEWLLLGLQKENAWDVGHCGFFKFQYGGQRADARFQRLFIEFFAYARGVDGLVTEGAYKLIECFGRKRVGSPYYSAQPYYSDVYGETRSFYGDGTPGPGRGGNFDGDYVVYRYPLGNIQKNLSSIIEENYGLSNDFLQLLKHEHRTIKNCAEMCDREALFGSQEDTFWDVFGGIFVGLTLGAGAMLSPRLGDKLKEIFARLLAIKWLEQDQQNLRRQLSFKPLLEKKLLLPTHALKIKEQRYVICPTSPDGACALHALLGERINGEYQYQGDVRKLFTDALTEKRTNPHLQILLTRTLKNHLENAINGSNPSSCMLFPKTPKGFQNSYILLRQCLQTERERLNTQEAQLWMGMIKNEPFKKRLLEIRMLSQIFARESPEQLLEKLTQDPSLILNIINIDRLQFLHFLDSHTQKNPFAELLIERENIFEKLTQEQTSFVLSDQVFNRYKQIVQQDDFFFNTEELHLAAYLFNKKVQIIANKNNEEPQFAENLFNPDLDGETTYIFHSEVHFSRCMPSEEPILSDFQGAYNKAQHAAKVQIQQDVQAQELLESTAKQEICQIGVSGSISLIWMNPTPFTMQVAKSGTNLVVVYFDPYRESNPSWVTTEQEICQLATSGGISFFSMNPIPITSQVVKSSANLVEAYFDPDKENNLSWIAKVISPPVEQLVTGSPLQVVAISFVVDQVFEMKKQKGVEKPEWLKNLVISSISALVDKDPETKVVSGLFGSAIKGGMDGAFHTWEDFCEIEGPYWKKNPSWIQCGMKTGFTNDFLQEAMTNKLTQLTENPEETNDSLQEAMANKLT